MNFIEYINKIGYPTKLIHEVIEDKNSYVYKIFIKGKLQVAPKWELKVIQKILKNYLEEFYLNENVSKNATAYIKKQNISFNVNRHQGNSYFFTTDFKNFFPSITKEILEKELFKILKNESKDSKILILNIIQYKNRLQYGFPTSPIISNIIMNDFDKKLFNLLELKYSTNNIQYTRYADDITISSKYKIEKKELYSFFKKMLENKYSFLKINDKKTRIFEKYAKNPYITGLIPLNKRNSIGKKKINQLKINIYLILNNILIKNKKFYPTKQSLRSYLSYLYIVDKHNYYRLKYYFSKSEKDYKIEDLFTK